MRTWHSWVLGLFLQAAPNDPSAPVNPWVIIFLFGSTISALAIYIHRQDQKTIADLTKRLARWEDVGPVLVENAAAQPDPLPPLPRRRRPPSRLPSPLVSPPRPEGAHRGRKPP